MTLLKLIGAPGSLTFLAACLALLGLARWWRPAWLQSIRTLALVIVTLYLLLSLPVVAAVIAGGAMAPAAPDPPHGPLDVIVVLDGDNRRGRTRAALALAQAAPQARVRVLGEPWIADALVESGLDSTRVALDRRAATTREQIDQVRDLAAARPATHMALVVSRLQMPRTAALVRAARLDVQLVAAPVDDEPASSGIRRFVPTYLALRVSRDAIYERAAVRYYAWHGWVD